MREIKLSLRLGCIAEFVPRGSRVADIGTDHALIPVFLAAANCIDCAVAADISAGPLDAARRNVEYYGQSEKVVCRQSDGFSEIKCGEVDCAIIAGMGGSMICKILDEGKIRVAELSCLVLQPQDGVAAVRTWLRENGWQISDEDLVSENGRMYEIIKAIRGLAPNSILESFSRLTLPDEVGPVLFIRAHPLLPEHIDMLVGEAVRVLEEMKKAKQPDKRKMLDYELKIIELRSVRNSLEVKYVS